MACAWLGHAPIPQALLRALAGSATMAARGQLVGRSFLTPVRATDAPDDSLQMHTVLASYLRSLSSDPADRVWNALVNQFDDTSIETGNEDRALLIALMPHVAWHTTRRPIRLEKAQDLAMSLSILGERMVDSMGLDLAAEIARREVVLAETEEDRGEAYDILGSALAKLGDRAETLAPLKEAITAFHSALEVRTRERLPLQWARTQGNLAIALQRLGDRTQDFSLLEDAATTVLPQGSWTVV